MAAKEKEPNGKPSRLRRIIWQLAVVLVSAVLVAAFVLWTHPNPGAVLVGLSIVFLLMFMAVTENSNTFESCAGSLLLVAFAFLRMGDTLGQNSFVWILATDMVVALVATRILRR